MMSVAYFCASFHGEVPMYCEPGASSVARAGRAPAVAYPSWSGAGSNHDPPASAYLEVDAASTMRQY